MLENRVGDHPGSQKLNWLWILAALELAVIYCLVNFVLPGVFPANWDLYLIQPALWLLLAGISYLGWRYLAGKRPVQTGFLLLALLIGLIQGLAVLGAGFLYGFGNSPYSHSGLTLLGNLVYAITPILAFEFTRAFLVQCFGKGRAFLALILISFLFTLLALPVNLLGSVEGVPGTFRFVGEYGLPTLAEQMLATFLVITVGPWPAIVYRVTLAASEWLPPILPQMPWVVTAFVKTIVPALAIPVLNIWVSPPEAGAKPKNAAADAKPDAKQGGWLSWIVVAVFAILVLWFNTGMFGVRPFLVSGVSMNPTFYAGDVVVTSNVSADSIQVGDIIRYKRYGESIVHRVKQIQDDHGQPVFITRGDNNNVDDSPVPYTAYEGKVILKIPKIGWVGILIRWFLDWLRGLV